LIDYIAKDGRINVLLTGETGTGKELVARLIHRNGWRSNGSYEAISLAALAPSIIESELFGHEKGAFTDARERKIGFIELADKGVLFLDDIDIAPLDVQVKLLRFLEERSFCRSGGTHLIDIDVQLISATNQNLLQLTKDGKFRKDLYFRLKTVEVHIPPLREHAEDIPDLVSHFLRLLQKQGRTQIEACSLEALDAMLSYQWPGNIRELENCIENAVLFAKIKGHEKIELEDLPGELWHEAKTEKKALNIELAEEGINLEEKKARYELSYIESALEKSRGHKTEAWRILGLHDRFVLRRRVKAIERRFSQLIEEFPLIKKAFSK
jgi:DNA-binding NtrC family response regulator